MQILKKIPLQCLFALLLASSILLFSAQKPPTREYQIKAVFLFNFTQFVEWPDHAFPTAHSPLVIGILGEDPFNGFLNETVAGEKVKEHPLVIERYRTPEEIQTCHILFISSSQKNKSGIIESLKGRGVLTVSDAANFMQEGGMIRFFTAHNKIKFQINPEAAKSEGLIISSKLLRLAEIVVPTKK